MPGNFIGQETCPPNNSALNYQESLLKTLNLRSTFHLLKYGMCSCANIYAVCNSHIDCCLFANRENASEMMIELLRTYDNENATQAKDDATNCIISFIDRPDVWIMDHLLELGPVKSLNGELIYQVFWVL